MMDEYWNSITIKAQSARISPVTKWLGVVKINVSRLYILVYIQVYICLFGYIIEPKLFA